MMKKLLKFLRGLGLAILSLLICLGILFAFTSRDSSDPVKEYACKNPYITETGKAYVSAHRSGGGMFPENTLMAFENCINSESFNTDIFEFDLHITSDGELILLHDSTLDRTTNAEEVFGKTECAPADYTYAEIATLNFGDGFSDSDENKPYKGLADSDVPDNLRAVKLETVLEYLESNGSFGYIIEIKDSDELGFKAADELYSILSERNMLDKAIIGTFNGEVTEYMDEKYPDMLRSCGIAEGIVFYLYAFFDIDRNPESIGFEALQIPSDAYVINLGTTRVVNYAHKYDIAVQYWTINDVEEIEKLNSVGADAIISDYPERAYAVINGLDTDELV